MVKFIFLKTHQDKPFISNELSRNLSSINEDN